MKKGIFVLFGIIVLIILIQFVSSTIIDRGSYWNKIDNGGGSYNLEVYNSIINIINGSDYISINTTLENTSINILSTDYEAYNGKGKYQVYYKEQSSGVVNEPVRFIKENYTITITPNSLIFLGQTNLHKKQSFVNITGNYGTYENQFGDGIDLRYSYYNEMLKKDLIINSLQELKDAIKSSPSQDDILQLKFTVKGYNINNESELNNLKVGGSRINFNQDLTDVSTDQNIEFLDSNNNTIYYFPRPYVEDLNGTKMMLNYTYDVNKFANLVVKIQVPYSWLQNAVYPITIDPSVVITGSGGGADAYVALDSPNTSHGTEQDFFIKWGTPKMNSYFLFNISILPRYQLIDSAQICAYLYRDQGTQTIGIYQVYSNWQENAITWNNQSCGINFDNNTNCNLTSESSKITNGDLQAKWACWNVTSMLNIQYVNNYNNLSFALHTSDSGNEDKFYSKEYTNSSLWPYLNITYHTADVIAPNLTIISPINKNYTSSSILVNISAQDANLQSIWFYNGTGNTTYVSSGYYNFSQGVNTLVAYANDSLGNLNTSSVTFYVDSLAPNLNIAFPEVKTYGINTSLPLNFSVSDSGIGVQSCWYNLDNGINKTITNCQNLTFNISSDRTYTLNLFANDSFGNLNSSSVTFSVLTSAPALNLVSPTNNSFLNYNNIYFNYSIFSGIGISSCQLFGDFDGTWKLNQTNNSISLEQNFFILNLTDRVYNLGVVCNDSLNRISAKNYNFIIDTIAPNLSLIEPSGTKSSQSSIPLTFNVNDTNLDSCWYKLTYNAGGSYVDYPGKEKVIINNCSSTTFDVVNDYSYILNLYANDSAGNTNSASSSFSVSTSVTPPSNTGGGGGRTIIKSANTTIGLNLDKISDLIGEPGDDKKIILKVKNTGTGFLNDCQLNGYGDYYSWISGGSTKDLSAGEEYEYNFDINIPENISGGKYPLGISLNCKEINKSSFFNVEIIEKQINFDLIKVERVSSNSVKVSYSLEELSGLNQNIDIQFLLFGPNKERAAEFQETKTISANSKQNFESLIPIDSSLEGELSLLVNLNSKTYSTFVEENIVLGKTPIGGFAIFGNIGGSENIFTVLLILLFLIFAFFIIRRIFHHKKNIKIRKVTKRIKESSKKK